MKTILKIAAVFITSTFSWASSPTITKSSPIPLGPKMIVWALQQAHSGTLNVSSDGLDYEVNYSMSLEGVKTLKETLKSFDFEGIQLKYTNPNSYTISTGEILDSNGQALFRANHWWKLQKTLSDDGLKASYLVPDWAGNLWFQLQDISVPFDGESATVHLSDGVVMTLDVFDGQVSLPGALSWSQGTVEIIQNGLKSYFDIGSGAQVSNTRILARTQGIGLDSIEQIPNSGMTVDVWTYISYGGYYPIYETVPSQKGMFAIKPKVIDSWQSDSGETVEDLGIRPLGVWFVDVDKLWKYVEYPTDAESIEIPVIGGESLFFYFEWDESAGKG